jgi:AraC-like DNA-binding protein
MTTQDASPEAGRQPILFSTSDFPSPQDALTRFSALIADVCDVAVLGEIEHFKVISSSLHLGQASLGVDTLCDRFELSRAGLYRLFAPTSPAGYIQERRLHRAYAMLISPAFRAWRIIDIAVECRFSSDATFIRAFRRQFGITPGDVRELADRKVSDAPPGKTAPLAEPDAESARWLKELTGAMPQVAARE